jgi:hypothetical protein
MGYRLIVTGYRLYTTHSLLHREGPDVLVLLEQLHAEAAVPL